MKRSWSSNFLCFVLHSSLILTWKKGGNFYNKTEYVTRFTRLKTELESFCFSFDEDFNFNFLSSPILRLYTVLIIKNKFVISDNSTNIRYYLVSL